VQLSAPRTPLQERRYAAILRSTLARLRESGYEGTRIVDIAADSGAALATIYRYFGSRENLIFTAVQGWVIETSQRSYPQDPGAPLAQRLADMIRISAERLVAEPELLRAWTRARLTSDPFVARHTRLDSTAESLLIYPAEVLADPALALELSTLMEHAWFSGVVKWSLGQKDYAEVWGDVLQAMRVVLRARRG